MKYKYLILLLLLPILAGAQITVDNNMHKDDLQRIDFSEIDTVSGNWVAKDQSGNGYDMKLVDSNIAVFDGVDDYLSFSGLTVNDTIMDWVGTSTPSLIDSTRINFTAGNMSYLLLSNGSEYRFSEGADGTIYDIVNGIHATVNNYNYLTFWDIENTEPDNEINGFSNGKYCESTGTIYKQSHKKHGLVGDYFEKCVSDSRYIYISNLPEYSGTENSYYVWVSISTGKIYIAKRVNGSFSSLEISSGKPLILPKDNIRIIIFRNSYVDEYFLGDKYATAVYLQGKTFPITSEVFIYPNETKMELYVSTNLTVDIEQNYIGFLEISGNTISSLRTDDGIIDLHSFDEGTGAYMNLYIPAISDTLDAIGARTTNPAGFWHNKAETKMLQYTNVTLSNYDPNFWYSSGTPVVRSWEDIPDNYSLKIYSDIDGINKTNISLSYPIDQKIYNTNTGKLEVVNE